MEVYNNTGPTHETTKNLNHSNLPYKETRKRKTIKAQRKLN